jgi:uncharacterized protein YkwD
MGKLQSNGRIKPRQWSRLAWLATVVAALALSATACVPPAQPTSAPAPAAAPGLAADATPSDPTLAGVLNAMNRDRAANGAPALAWNNQLGASGANWAAHLASAGGALVHQNLSTVLSSPPYASFHTLGENLLSAPTGTTPDTMENLWMNSSAHRANILNPSFTRAGVGYAVSKGQIVVAVEFGG